MALFKRIVFVAFLLSATLFILINLSALKIEIPLNFIAAIAIVPAGVWFLIYFCIGLVLAFFFDWRTMSSLRRRLRETEEENGRLLDRLARGHEQAQKENVDFPLE